MRDRALEGVKVIEYGNLVSAPFCGKILRDLGAEVIKIEETGVGDSARRTGPFLADIPHPERSGLFLYLNSGKLSITLNLRTTTGVEIFKQLVRDSDIFIENNPPKVMKELGIDYQSLKGVKPNLIMTSITLFGQTGPYRDYKSSELTSFHMSGMAYVTPRMAKDTSQEPLKVSSRLADFYTGLCAAAGALSALFAREAVGSGQHVDISQLESLIPVMDIPIAFYSALNRISTRVSPMLGAPWHILACKDGYVHIAGLEERHWQRLVELMGNPEWADEQLFQDATSRGEYWDALEPLISTWTMEHTKEEIYHQGQAMGIPIGPVYTMEDMANSKHLAARRFFVDIEHPETGKVKYPGVPYRFSETSCSVERPAPLLGQHNKEVYCHRLNYTQRDLVKFREAGII